MSLGQKPSCQQINMLCTTSSSVHNFKRFDQNFKYEQKLSVLLLDFVRVFKFFTCSQPEKATLDLASKESYKTIRCQDLLVSIDKNGKN